MMSGIQSRNTSIDFTIHKAQFVRGFRCRIHDKGYLQTEYRVSMIQCSNTSTRLSLVRAWLLLVQIAEHPYLAYGGENFQNSRQRQKCTVVL